MARGDLKKGKAKKKPLYQRRYKHVEQYHPDRILPPHSKNLQEIEKQVPRFKGGEGTGWNAPEGAAWSGKPGEGGKIWRGASFSLLLPGKGGKK